MVGTLLHKFFLKNEIFIRGSAELAASKDIAMPLLSCMQQCILNFTACTALGVAHNYLVCKFLFCCSVYGCQSGF